MNNLPCILSSFIGLVFCSSVVTAAPVPGDNLVNNPQFAPNRDGLPANWNYCYGKERDHLRLVEENGVRHVEFLPVEGECKLWQTDMHLVPGARYRMSVQVKTKDLVAGNFGFVITSWAWLASDGPQIPKDTAGEWVTVEKEVVAPESMNAIYRFGVYVVDMKGGSMSVRAPFLAAVDESGLAGFEPAPKIDTFCHVTPIAPLLEDIPAGDSEMLFAYWPKGSDLRCEVMTRMDGEPERMQGSFPVVRRRAAAKLTGMRTGAKGTMRIVVKDGAETVCTDTYAIAVREPVKMTRPPERKLNGLVTRLLTVDAPSAPVVFSTPRDTWAWIRLGTADDRAALRMDGEKAPLVLSRHGDGFETMRWIAKGDHTLEVTNGNGGTLIVNSVPELFCYSYPGGPLAKGSYSRFAGDFRLRYLYPSFNTFGYGYHPSTVTQADWNDFYARGKKLLISACGWRKGMEGWNGRLEGADHLARRLEAEMKGTEGVSGFTYDEIYISEFKPKWIYADAMRLLQGLEKRACVWSSGYHFPQTALDAEYLSACVNASHGRGRFFFECYPQYEGNDEKTNEAYLEDLLNVSLRKARNLVPVAGPNSMFVLGLYTNPCGLHSYDNTCDADPKWLHGRYLHRLATDSEFNGIAGFGLYAYANGEEEDVRWICAVVRHYMLEGRKDDFASRYGIRVNPGIVRNGTFRQGLDGWTVRPAAEGSIRSDKVAGYAHDVLHRRHCEKRGDELCVFRRQSEKPNVLRQKLANLVPGKTYVLRYEVSPYAEIKDLKGKSEVRRYAFSVALKGARDVTAEMPIAAFGGAETNTTRLNHRTVVFRPESNEVELAFYDWNAPADAGGAPGEELALSSVRINPYFAE